MIFDVKKVRFYRVDLKGTEAGWLPASGGETAVVGRLRLV